MHVWGELFIEKLPKLAEASVLVREKTASLPQRQRTELSLCPVILSQVKEILSLLNLQLISK